MHKKIVFAVCVLRSRMMTHERWAVAYSACDVRLGEFLWLRDEAGAIMIFASKQEAVVWVEAGMSFGSCEDDVLYFKLPPVHTLEETDREKADYRRSG